MSTFKVEVVPFKMLPHPNADSLSIVNVFDAFTVCVRTSDWIGVDKAAFVPPDSVVPNTPEYAWLDGKLRIKAKKLRGIVSQGMFVPAPEGSIIGDDVAAQLGIVHYEPDLHMNQGNVSDDPPIPGIKYDLENWFKYRGIFDEYPGIKVTITEKIHGANARFTYQSGRMWCGSREFFRFQNDQSLYWQALYSNPWIEAYCRLNENAIVYGEVFGWVQKLRYGATQKSKPMFRMFDVFEFGKFIEWTDHLIDSGTERIVPVLYHGPYSHDIVEKFIDGNSVIPGANHIREGVVIKPTKELWHPRVGRVILKAVSPTYLEKS
jgi:RNA ligase (TIGR02306 family)